jgi:hypothetical protein
MSRDGIRPLRIAIAANTARSARCARVVRDGIAPFLLCCGRSVSLAA